MTLRELATVTVYVDPGTGEVLATIRHGRTPFRTIPFRTRRGLMEHVADRLGDEDSSESPTESKRETYAI